MFEKIARWYKLGLWTVEMVRFALEKGVITQDEYDEIIK